ncbi:ubiquitin-conjugating enzyme 9 [Mycena crocata]|nr:ubiquitin-conjugating enzyme 9 [Mycena crocata]
MLVCRPSFRLSNIKLHPFNWHMPVVDLKQWEAHIPGVRGTPWEGGVYTLQLTFFHGLSEAIPKLRFIRPLFHVNIYPSGTWGFVDWEVVEFGVGIGFRDVWKKTKLEDPMRLATLLQSIQKHLNEPNTQSPAQSDAYTLIKTDPEAYQERIRTQAADWTPDPRTGLAGRPILQPNQDAE